MMYSIRYRPGTQLAQRFGHMPNNQWFDSIEEAEEIRRHCPNAEHMEVVPV